MNYQLVKREDRWDLYEATGQKIASSLDGCPFKLSLKNCQAIERGYDLNELISESNTSHLSLFTSDSHELMYDEGFKVGFQKALELMGDKKFSEEDMKNTMNWIMNEYFEFHEQPTTARREHYIQSLQQTECDVEIEMEWIQSTSILGNPHQIPKLDADGCLILKRIKTNESK